MDNAFFIPVALVFFFGCFLLIEIILMGRLSAILAVLGTLWTGNILLMILGDFNLPLWGDFSVNLLGILRLGLGGILLVRILITSGMKKLPAQLLLPVVFLSLATLSLLFSPSRSDGLRYITNLLAPVFLGIVAYKLSLSSDQRERITISTLMLLLVIYLAGVVTPERFWYYEPMDLDRFIGIFQGPNQLAWMLTISICLTLPLVIYCSTKLCALFVLALAVELVALIFTFSRTGWISTAIGMFVIVLMSGKKKLLIPMIGCYLAFFFMSRFVELAFGDLMSLRTLEMSNVALGTFQGRMEIWDNLVSQITPESFLLGHGTGSARLETRLLYTGYDPGHPHSDWVELLFDYGLVGASLYLAWLTLIFRRSSSLLKVTNNWLDRSIALASMGAVAVAVTGGAADTLLGNASAMGLFTLIMAMGAAIPCSQEALEPSGSTTFLAYSPR